MLFRLLCVAWLVWASEAFAAFSSSRGFYGYGYVPTARTLPQGSLGYSFSMMPIAEVPDVSREPGLQMHHALVAQPLPWLEAGSVAHRTPYDSGAADWAGELAGKIVLPRAYAWQPALAFGAYDVLHEDRFLQHIYFVGGFDWRAFDGGLSMDIGAIYHRRRNGSDPASPTGTTSFLAMEADFGVVDLIWQNFWEHNQWGTAPGVFVRPFAKGPGPSWLELGAGAAWRVPDADAQAPVWAAVQLNLPLAAPRDSAVVANDSATWLWIDMNGWVDHSIGEGEFPLRGTFELEGVCATVWTGLYLVNAVGLQASTPNEDRLVTRDFWDRSYLLYEPLWRGWRGQSLGVGLPTLAGGMLNSRILGVQAWEKLYVGGFVPAVVNGGWVQGRAESWNATLEAPLHPILPGMFDQTQFFAEGGYYLGNHLGFQVSMRQGSERNHLQLGVGYDRDARTVLAEVAVKLDLQSLWSVQGHGIAIRTAPNFSHRSDIPLYVYEYNAPIYVDGNGPRRLHGVPWTR